MERIVNREEWMSTLHSSLSSDLQCLTQMVASYCCASLCRSVFPAYPGQWLDIVDTAWDWIEAQVVSVDPSEASSKSGDNGDRSAHDMQKIRVHYKGWKERYDEDLWIARKPPQITFVDHVIGRNEYARALGWSWIALVHTHSYPFSVRGMVRGALLVAAAEGEEPERIPAPPASSNVCLDVDTNLDVLDPAGEWLRGIVIAHDLDHCMVLIRYFGWSSKFDEWINAESPRLAPLFTNTLQPAAA